MNWLETVLSPALVRALGWTIVHSLWQGAVVGLALVGLLLVLRRHSAQVRYNVACVALATMVGLALATFVRHYTIALANPETVATAANAAEAVSSDFLQRSAVVPSAEAIPAGGVQSWLQYFDHNLPLIVAAWLLGLLAMTLRLLGGLAYVQRLRHYRVQPLAAHWNERLETLSAKAGLNRTVTLLESALVKAPLVAGHLKPVILLPLGTVLGLTPAQLEAILAHELAHIARRDYLMNILQSIAEILFFYHPAVWFITACVRTERENCCDDEATAICGDPLTLARALAALAEMGHDVHPTPQLALSAVGPDGSLLGRIRRLVQRRAAPTFSEGVMAALVVMGGLVLLGLTAAVSMAAPKPWADKAKALAGLVTGPDNRLWLHSLETMHQDTLPPVPAASPALATGQDDGDKDKKKSKRKDKDGNQRIIITGGEELDGPDRYGRRGNDDGTVVVKRDKKGRATEIFVDGRRIDLQEDNKKAKGGSTEIIRLAPQSRADSRRRVQSSDDFAFSFNDGSGNFGMSFKDREALRVALPKFNMNLDLHVDEAQSATRRARNIVSRNGNRVEIRTGKNVEIIDTEKVREDAMREAEQGLREAEQGLRESLRTTKDEDVRARLQDELDRLQERREEQQEERQQALEDARRDREEAQRERDEERRQRDEEHRQRDEERRQRDEERRRDDEKNEAALSRQLRTDGLISDPGNYQFRLNANELTVNGKKQPTAVRDKYLALMQTQTGRKMTTGTYAISRNTDSSTSSTDMPSPPSPPRVPVTPRAPRAPRSMVAPTTPRVPLPPAAPRKPPVNSTVIGDQLRKDGLIGKDDKSYQLQLNQSGMRVNGQKQPDEVAKKYRTLLNHTGDQKFNVDISVSE